MVTSFYRPILRSPFIGLSCSLPLAGIDSAQDASAIYCTDRTNVIAWLRTQCFIAAFKAYNKH